MKNRDNFNGDLDPVERRYYVQVRAEERHEYANPDPITDDELPTSTSHSGWMRTQEEAQFMQLILGPNPTKMKRKKNLRCRRD